MPKTFSFADISQVALFEVKSYRQKLSDRQLRIQGPTLPNTLPITDINSGLAGTTSYQRGSAIKRFNGIGGNGSFTSDKYPGIPKSVTIDETIVKKPRRSIPIPPPPPPRPKMLAMIKVRMKNGKIILRQDEINTVENTVKTKPVGSNAASKLKDRPGALALRESNTMAKIGSASLVPQSTSSLARPLDSAMAKNGRTALATIEKSSTSASRGGGKGAAIALGLVAGAGGIGYLANQRSKSMTRQNRSSNPSFSMSEFQASFEACSDREIAEFGLMDDMKQSYDRGARSGAKAGAATGKALGNAGRAIGKKAVAAKNKVAVLVKNANGKVFIQQRMKNVTDAARSVGGAIKANPGKSGLAALAVIGAGAIAYDRTQDTPGQRRQLAATVKAFNENQP